MPYFTVIALLRLRVPFKTSPASDGSGRYDLLICPGDLPAEFADDFVESKEFPSMLVLAV